MDLSLSKNFMQYEADSGFMLHYLAQSCRDTIERRTARGKSVTGAAFTPHKQRTALSLNEDGTIRRDDKGRWVEGVVRSPSDPVRLRSPYNVPRGRRMMDNLIIMPRILDAKALTFRKIRAAYIRPGGGWSVARVEWGAEHTSENAAMRRRISRAGSLGAAAKEAGMKRKDFKAAAEAVNVREQRIPHKWRANTCQTGANAKNCPRREFLGISDAELKTIVGAIRRDHVLAFVKEAKRSIRRQVGRKARAAAKRAMRARKRGADAAEARAVAEHKRIVDRHRKLFGDRAV